MRKKLTLAFVDDFFYSIGITPIYNGRGARG